MRTITWLSGRRTAGVLVACMLVFGVASPPAAAQCESAKLLAFDGATDDQFGVSVSISGDVVVVSAPLTTMTTARTPARRTCSKSPLADGWI